MVTYAASISVRINQTTELYEILKAHRVDTMATRKLSAPLVSAVFQVTVELRARCYTYSLKCEETLFASRKGLTFPARVLVIQPLLISYFRVGSELFFLLAIYLTQLISERSDKLFLQKIHSFLLMKYHGEISQHATNCSNSGKVPVVIVG